jgi:chloramphenicol O-acetyltransferase
MLPQLSFTDLSVTPSRNQIHHSYGQQSAQDGKIAFGIAG